MTGIMSSIPGTEAARPAMRGQEGASPQEDIVSEVRGVNGEIIFMKYFSFLKTLPKFQIIANLICVNIVPLMYYTPPSKYLCT